MKNKMFWLVLKGVLIILLIITIFAMPTDDNFRKWFRFLMLIVFVISFIIDLNAYKGKNH